MNRLPPIGLYILVAASELCAASACSDFHAAQVAGFVKSGRTPRMPGDSDRGPGVNQAEVRMYFDEPESFDDEGFIAYTSTAPNLTAGVQLDGFYSHRIAWDSSSSDFGADGDARTLWIATRHPDFEDAVTSFDAVLSDDVNVLPDILMERLNVGPELVTGQVLFASGTTGGADGVRVVLELAPSEDGSTAKSAKYATLTQAVDGTSGIYLFDQVRWPAKGGDTRAASISVDDDRFVAALPANVQLVADERTDVTLPLFVEPIVFFVPSLRGRVVDLSGRGINGVRLTAEVVEGRALAGMLWATVSGPVDGIDGAVVFPPMAWALPDDAEFVDVTDSQHLNVRVDDPAYERSSGESSSLLVAVANRQDGVLPQELVVQPKPRTEFTARLEGRCSDGLPGNALRGVAVELQYEDDDGKHRLTNRTDADGNYAFQLAWSAAKPDKGSPPGQDAVDVEISFSDLTLGQDEYTFDNISYEVRSWVEPNEVPDAIAIAEDDNPDGGT